jgi:integrase
VVFVFYEGHAMPRPKKLPDTLNAAERQALLAAPRRSAPTGHRDLCLITLMLNAGLRASEALHLRARDIDWTSEQIMVREGKGKKDRSLWLNEADLDLLRSWKSRRPIAGELLFTTLHGTPLKDRDLRAMVKRRARKAGIVKDVHPHMLRHYLPFLTMSGNVGKRRCKRSLGAAFTRDNLGLFRKTKNRHRIEMTRSVGREPCESRIHLLSLLFGRRTDAE